jgi:hypothetical protein
MACCRILLNLGAVHTVHLSKTHGELLASRLFFYNALELGMITIGINVPVLWGLFTELAPDVVFRIGRGVTSLASRSLRLNSSSASSSFRDRRGSYSSSTKNIYLGAKETNASHATHDADPQSVPPVPAAQILVNQSVEVMSNEKVGEV